MGLIPYGTGIKKENPFQIYALKQRKYGFGLEKEHAGTPDPFPGLRINGTDVSVPVAPNRGLGQEGAGLREILSRGD